MAYKLRETWGLFNKGGEFGEEYVIKMLADINIKSN